jgi:hypothetical protein
MRAILMIGILFTLLATVPAVAQSPLPPVGGDEGMKETGYYSIIVDPKDYPGIGKDETEDVRFLSLLVVHGLVNGIDWRRTGPEHKIQIDEKMYKVIHERKLEGVEPYDDCFRYSYSYQYVTGDIEALKEGKSIDAVGESTETNMAKAWQEARHAAFVDAVQKALDREYTDNQLAIPNDTRGMITTYEIVYDDYNYADKVYRFQIKAWVSFQPRVSPFEIGLQSGGGTQSGGQGQGSSGQGSGGEEGSSSS